MKKELKNNKIKKMKKIQNGNYKAKLSEQF